MAYDLALSDANLDAIVDEDQGPALMHPFLARISKVIGLNEFRELGPVLAVRRLLALACVLWMLSTLPANDAAAADPPHAHGIHGMVLFGERSLYASHLPLYSPPHDHQALLELRIADTEVAQAVRKALIEGQQLTIEPERFDLLRLDPASREPLRSFKAKLYRGHFERGGELWRDDVEFRVRRTLVFRSLSAETPKPRHMRYFAFGDGRRVYLVHRIHGRPDFDQILSLKAVSPSMRLRELDIPAADEQPQRLGTGAAAADWLRRKNWSGAREIYFETSDLQ